MMRGITTDLLLKAYAQGYFPMAESAQAKDVFWVDPDHRGVIPLDAFHIPKRLQQTVRHDPFRVTVDKAFGGIMRACAAAEHGRANTWINDIILELYERLHQEGHAHSIECWREGKLVGGLYGVSLGAAFFGESMFHNARDASKVALVHLAARLKVGGYRLLDTQFVTPHLRQFGAIEMPRITYHAALRQAVHGTADFFALPEDLPGEAVLQAITQTS